MGAQRSVWNLQPQDLPDDNAKIRTLVVDDTVSMREAICAVVGMDATIAVIGEAGDGIEALELTAQLRPDLVLMDICMPVLDGLQTATLILQHFPETRVVLMSADETANYRQDSEACGADAFISKIGFPEEFMEVREMLFPPDGN